MNFTVGILQTLVKSVQVEIVELITCSGTGTGMLVKRALTSNETNVSSSGFIERCLIFLMKSVLSLTKDEVLPQLFWKILVMNLAVLYVAVPQAETMGHIGMLSLWILGSCCWGIGTMRSYLGVFCSRDEIVILVVLQNFNEFLVDSWKCVFGEILINWVVGGLHIL